MRLPIKIMIVLLLCLALVLSAFGCKTTPVATTSETTAVSETTAIETTTADEKTSDNTSSKDTLIFNLDVDITGGLDATQTLETTGLKVSTLISETLVGIDWETNEAYPILAESYDVASDGKSITFKIREGVKFQDGTELNADAVLFNFNRVTDTNNEYNKQGNFPYASYIADLKMEKIDDFTVRVSTDIPDPMLLWKMGLYSSYIQSPTAVEKYGKDYTLNPVGTGPYKFISYEQGVKAVLERNEDYWGDKPAIKNIIFKINPDNQSKIADLLAGNVDVITRVPADQIAVLEKTSGVKVYKFPTMVNEFWVFNCSKEALKDKRVRQALNYAYDKKKLEEVNQGRLVAQYYPWVEGASAFNSDVQRYDYDPEKAKQLLKEAGYENGLKLTLVTNPDDSYKPWYLLLQQNLKDVGVDLEIKVIDSASFYDPKVGVFNKDTFDLCLSGWATPYPDLGAYFQRWYSKDKSPDGWNISQYENADADKIMEQAKNMMDKAQRDKLLEELQVIIADDPPWIFSVRNMFVVAARDDVEGLYIRPNWISDLTRAYFK
ncbi:MAG: ABC transporter substrate-binding protein [Actinomycetota bacterium]|nr:ABC transporter substrate-binding protein [Actinomycetota bacterium]